MKKNTRLILSGLFVLILTALACTISIPGSGTIDSAATSVAGTVNALAGAAADVFVLAWQRLQSYEAEPFPELAWHAKQSLFVAWSAKAIFFPVFL